MISLEYKKRVGYIVFNKPKANGYDIDFMKLLDKILDEAVSNKDIKIIALKSSLPKFFCAGADIKVFAQNTIEENKEMVKHANIVSNKLANCPKITIALLNGHTLGGGLELALACDLRIASEKDYQIGMSEINLGLMPGNGGTQRLIRTINPNKALELLISGQSINSDYAFEIGLVNTLYPESEFEESSRQYLETLAQRPIQAMAAIKEVVTKGMELPLINGLILEGKLSDSLFETDDAKEGLTAFLERRTPKFK